MSVVCKRLRCYQQIDPRSPPMENPVSAPIHKHIFDGDVVRSKSDIRLNRAGVVYGRD
jgi:hypothetical protein